MVQFTLKCSHKYLKLFLNAFLTISDPKETPPKKLSSLAVVHCTAYGSTKFITPKSARHADMARIDDTWGVHGRVGVGVGES